MISITILLTSCTKSDYIEPEDRTVVTAIIINYQDDEYSLIFENVKQDEEEEKEYSPEYINGSGKDLKSAVFSAQSETTKELSLYHCPVILCDKKTYMMKSEEIFDYILSNPQISLAAYLVLINDNEMFNNSEAVLGYEVTDAIEIKGLRPEIINILRNREEPADITLNLDNKIIVLEG